MSDYSSKRGAVSRRNLLQGMAATAAAVSGVTPAMAQRAREKAEEERKATGEYQPKALNDHEYQTLQKLADWIIPAGANTQGALKAGAADWIDLMSSESEEMLAIYTGGIFWLDAATRRRHGKNFADATEDNQRELLDLIAYRKNESPELGPGIRFFAWVRKMVVDAYYTSPAGIEELGYLGNKAVSKFQVPAECMDYAIQHSPA
jgi:gluconate 2-dehydrogenase gamma chain